MIFFIVYELVTAPQLTRPKYQLPTQKPQKKRLGHKEYARNELLD
jgi:hypothetical protein